MTEFEILEIIGFRGDRMWSLIQWWSSVSFAVMTAAYFGSQKLNGVTASIILAMYSITTAAIFQALFNQISFIDSAYLLLQDLETSGAITVIGADALVRNADSPIFMPVFFAGGFLFTFGFVFYCHKKLGDSK